jgi:hypothetical protein
MSDNILDKFSGLWTEVLTAVTVMSVSLKMEAVCASETFGLLQTTRRYNLENRRHLRVYDDFNLLKMRCM